MKLEWTGILIEQIQSVLIISYREPNDMRTKGNSVGDTEFGCRETVRLIAFFVAFLHTLALEPID